MKAIFNITPDRRLGQNEADDSTFVYRFAPEGGSSCLLCYDARYSKEPNVTVDLRRDDFNIDRVSTALMECLDKALKRHN